MPQQAACVDSNARRARPPWPPAGLVRQRAVHAMRAGSRRGQVSFAVVVVDCWCHQADAGASRPACALDALLVEPSRGGARMVSRLAGSAAVRAEARQWRGAWHQARGGERGSGAAAATGACRWQATVRPCPKSTKGGSSLRQRGHECAQRVWKRQPAWPQRAGHLAVHHDAPAGAPPPDRPPHRRQRACVRGAAARGRGVSVAISTMRPGTSRDAVLKCRTTPVVGDEQVGQPAAAATLQHVDTWAGSTRPARHRLVADDQAGLERQRARDADALALATENSCG